MFWLCQTSFFFHSSPTKINQPSRWRYCSWRNYTERIRTPKSLSKNWSRVSLTWLRMLPFCIVHTFPSFTFHSPNPGSGQKGVPHPQAWWWYGLQVLFVQLILCEPPDRRHLAKKLACIKCSKKLLRTLPMVRDQKPVYPDIETTIDKIW